MADDQGWWNPDWNGASRTGRFRHTAAGASHVQTKELFYRRWSPAAGTPARGLVVGCHGYGEHSGRYHRLGEALAGAGLELVMLDMSGHGHSASSITTLGKGIRNFGQLVDELAGLVTFIRTVDGLGDLPLFMFGHSWGGAITFLAAMHPDVAEIISSGPGRGVILSAPAFRVAGNILCPRPYWMFFRGLTNVLATVAPSLPSPAAASKDLTGSDDFNAKTSAAPLSFGDKVTAHTGNEVVLTGIRARESAAGFSASLLLLHGTADAIVPAYGSDEIFAAVASTDKKQIRYEGLRHEILNEPEEGMKVIADVLSWISERI